MRSGGQASGDLPTSEPEGHAVRERLPDHVKGRPEPDEEPRCQQKPREEELTHREQSEGHVQPESRCGHGPHEQQARVQQQDADRDPERGQEKRLVGQEAVDLAGSGPDSLCRSPRASSGDTTALGCGHVGMEGGVA